jgi:dihydrofolate reductase
MSFEIALANRRLIRANISWATCRIPVPPFVVIVQAGKWPARRLLSIGEVMRKLNVVEFMSLDGVIQSPGGAKEDASGGFALGSWIAPHRDEVSGAAMKKQMNVPADLLLGRKTFEIWSKFWPQHADLWPGSATATKYVASNTLTSSDWKPSVFLSGDLAKQIRELKQQEGPNLHVWGSANLVQTLLQHDLVDALWLKIFPVTLGVGKKLFAQGTIPAAFRVTESAVTPKGVIIINYERAGAVPTAEM